MDEQEKINEDFVPEQGEEQDELAKCQEEKKQLHEKYLRLMADFDNFRKRMQKERQELILYANEHIVLEFLEVMANFDRAIGSAGNTDVSSIMAGLVLVQKQFHDVLEQKGIKPIECVGKKFDPHFHEAISYEENQEVEEDCIIDEVQKGYLFHDKVIKHSKVRVAKKGGCEHE